MREDVLKNGIPLYAKGGSVGEDVPRETTKAYKMFRVDKKQPGKLFPLFVDADTPVEMNKWIAAKEGEKSAANTKKVKSKIGDLAYRPGWHAGDLPVATHIGEKDEEQKAETQRVRTMRDAHAATLGNTKAAKTIARKEHPYPSWVNAPRLRNPNHIWAEVEMPNDVDWQSEATKRGYNDQGKLIASQAHITDQLPKGGHYRYKTNSNMLGNWLIGGSMKVNRILHDKEVEAINKAAGAADLPRAKAMNQKAFGFAAGGTVGPEEFMAEEHVNYMADGGDVHSSKPAMGINVRSDKKANLQYADLIVDGKKTYESRNGDTLRPYVGKRVSIVRTGDGPAKAIGAVTVGEPLVVNRNKFRKMEQHHLVPEGSTFDIASGTKHLYPMHDPERYESERDVGHGIVARKVLAHGGNVSRGTIKEKVTLSPNMDVMQYELLTKKAK